MNTSRLILAAAMLAFAGTAAHSADKSEKREADLAKRLEGRTAGEPLTCISGYISRKLEVIEGVGLVYESGDTIYVARPTDPKALGNDIVVIDRFGGQLCNTDVVRTIDRTGGFITGALFLGKFVPYKKQN